MNESPFWNEDWMQLQQKYWQQWAEMGQKTAAFAQPQKSPWENAMDHWMKAVMPQQENPAMDLMQKMIDQGNIFLTMGESLSTQMSNTNDWTKALEKTFSQLTDNFDNMSNSSQESMDNMMGFWHSPTDNWQKFAATMGVNNAGQFADFANPLEKILSAPGIGFNREQEKLYKEFSQSVLDYQKALLNYNSIFKNLGADAVQRIQGKVEKLQQKGQTIDSAKAIYDLWVSVCEDSYAELAITDDYSKVHGELVNSLMKSKNLWGKIMDKVLADMNIPTQSQVKTLQSRLQESRREIRGLKRTLTSLQEEVAAIKTQQAQSASKPAVKTQQAQSASKPAVKTEQTKAAKPAAKKPAARKKAPVTKKAVVKKAVVKKAVKSKTSK